MLETLIGAGIGAAGSYLSGQSSARYAERSYKHRYRWMVNDLQKAGLNPMLAVSQGPGSPPQPDFPDIGEGAMRGGSAAAAAKLASAQTKAAEAATTTTTHQGNKAAAEGRAQEMQNLITEASPQYQSAKATLGERGEVRGPSAVASERWEAELSKLKNEGAKIGAETENVKLANELQKGELTLQEIKIKFAPALAELETAYKEAMARAAAAGVPAAEADAAFWQEAGVLGKAAVFLKSIFGPPNLLR